MIPQAAPMMWLLLYFFFLGVVAVVSAVSHWSSKSVGEGEVSVKGSTFEWGW